MALLRLTRNDDGTLATTAVQLATALYGSDYTAGNLSDVTAWMAEAEDVKGLLNLDADDALRIWLPVRRRVLAWAPDAPLDVQSEAALRLAGWLHHTRPPNPAGLLMEASGKGFRGTMAGAFIKSGAAEVLSPYRVHPVTVAGGAS